MAKQIVWTASAQRDHSEILLYWSERNKSNRYSLQLESLFFAATRLIAEHPGIGRPTVMEGTRSWPVRDYSIFYREEQERIIILRIWDNRRDPDTLKL